MVERGDRVEVLEDLVAQRALGLLVALPRGVEAGLEVAHELGRQGGVRHQHVVLVALREARAHPLAVLAVGAQDRELAAVEARGDDEPVQRVALRVAAPDGRDHLGHARAAQLDVERRAVGAEHAVLLHPDLVLLARQARGELLEHAQPEVLEHRHRLGELDLLALLVEAQPALLAERLQRDDVALAARQPAEAGDVVRGRVDRGVALVVAREAIQPRHREAPAGDGPVPGHQQVAQLVVPRARERDDLGLERAQRQLGQLAGRVDEEVHARALAVVEHVVRLDLRGAEAAPEQAAHALHQRGVVAPAREREDQRRVAPVDVAPAEQAHPPGALERQQRLDGAAQVVDRRGEQLVLREGVEQRDGGLVVVRALDQPEALEALAQLAAEQRRLGGGLGVGLGREQADQRATCR